MGWLKNFPNDRRRREAGHTTPTTGWLKSRPNDSSRNEAGHTNPTTGWLKSSPKDKCRRLWGHTTDARLAADTTEPRSSTCSDHAHSSIAAPFAISSIGSAHFKRRARTTGTRLETPTFELCVFSRVCDSLGRHKLPGVEAPIFTAKLGMLLQAPHIPSDASCSCRIDVYQRLSPPPHAWLRATAIASSRRRASPGQMEENLFSGSPKQRQGTKSATIHRAR